MAAPAFVTTSVTRVTETWKETPIGQRVIGALLAVAVVIGGVALAMYLAKPSLSPVFTNLSATDAQAVVEQLDSAGVTYELAAGGTTVLVPDDQVYAQRIALASAGVPSASDGYALLDNMSVTASDFQQQVTYQRAVEGELAKTIGAMNGVEAATVKLAIPEESVFTEEQLDPSASVFLQVAPATELDAASVQGVVNLVSAAVPGLQPTAVSVVDAKGQVLTGGGAGGAGGAGTSEYEDNVRTSVQAMLDRVVGPGNAAVAVQAETTPGTTERLSETFTPAEEGTPALNESVQTEEYTGGGGAATGILGPDNIAVPNNAQAGGDGGYTASDTVRNNAVNKVTEQTTLAAGGVARQSVSVVIDTRAAAGADMNQLTEMVSVAAGNNADRGDQVSVTAMAFDTTAAAEAEEALAAAEAAAAAEQQRNLIILGVIALIVLVVLFLIWRAVRKARRERREELDLTELRLLEEDDEDEDYEELEGAEELVALPPAPPEPVVTPAMEARNELAAMADEDPGAVAERLRDWMAVRR